jgi:aspartate racemase
MKTIGIVGGIGPESTITYYRLLVAAYRQRWPDGSYPPIIINSIDLTKMLDLIGAGQLAEVTEYLAGEVHQLARAGAELGLLAACTPHLVFDAIQRQSPIPLVSIVEATCETARALGLQRVGLFGTRFTMQGRFFPDVFERAGIAVIAPTPDEQTYIHDRYLTELVNGVKKPETRDGLLAIVERMKERDHVQGLILGGTELPVILDETVAASVPLLDTTQIHVAAVETLAWA